MRIAQRERRDLTLHVGAIADACDVQLARESGGNTLNRRSCQRARQTVQRRLLLVIARELEFLVALLGVDPRGQRHFELALWSFHLHGFAERDLYALRQRNRFLSNSRHKLNLFCPPRTRFCTPRTGRGARTPACRVHTRVNAMIKLPKLTQNLPAHMLLAGRLPGHHPARRGQDADPETAQHLGNFPASHINPASGTRYALDARDHRYVARRVFQINADALLRAVLGHLEVHDEADRKSTRLNSSHVEISY